MNVCRLLLLLAAVASPSVLGSKHKTKTPRNAHQVIDLPGLRHGKDVTFDHFGGQLELDTHEKLFYWYAESQSAPETDPIVLWLNGGPGCSSINGFFTENGPFTVQPDLTVEFNPYGWNRKANIVWVDSPAGVGFSTPLQNASYYNDDVVADRLHGFVGKFFEQYPELKSRDFYITGESYAGIYIPYLVNRLIEEPVEGAKLLGFAIGNPLTDAEIDGNAYMDYYYSHALVSRQNYHKMLEACSDEIAQCIFTKTNCSATCAEALDEGYAAADSAKFNHYYIYGDQCLINNGQGAALTAHHPSNKHKKQPTAVTHRGTIGPCADTFTDWYLNQPEVQQALHVDGAPFLWEDCKRFISQHFTKSLSSLPKYANILGRGYKILIYSGDADSVVNFIGTERWITEEGLNLTEVSPWKAWIGPDDQIAGYEQGYDGLTFKTIKGAGHMVPAVRPLHGLNLFECFVYGEEECATFTYPEDPYEAEVRAKDDDKNDKDDEQTLVATALNAETEPTPAAAFSATRVMLGVVAAGFVLFQFASIRHRRRGHMAIDDHERLPLAPLYQ